MQISSYPSIFNLGHRYLSELLLDPVLVEEKIDGSQFSFGKYDGEIWCRSKGQQIDPIAPEKMFALAVETVKSIADKLHDGWTYRGEYLSKPKHNTLAYARVPVGNIIIFDIMVAPEDYLAYAVKQAECERVGLECVPMIQYGMLVNIEELKSALDRESVLGGVKIEGVVVKNYFRFGIDKKILLGKFVSEAFKESHTKDWHGRHPQGKDIKDSIVEGLKVEARWRKAVQHLREAALISDSPQDIPLLLKEVGQDVLKEHEADIKEALFKWAWKDISRSITRGLPEWYKLQLAQEQFERETAA